MPAGFMPFETWKSQQEAEGPKCQWCRKRVSLELISTRHYGGKVYHGACFDTLEAMAEKVKGHL